MKNKFIPVFENFLPKANQGRENTALKEKIKSIVSVIKKGQSVFIPKDEMTVPQVRIIVKQELVKPNYKNHDIRVVASFEHEVRGCRIARFL